MGAVLLCTKCFAVHKPGQLTPFKVVQDPCEGASRAHARRKAYWAQRYLVETAAPANLFGSQGVTTATAKSRSGPACPTPPPCSPKVDPCRQDSEGDMGSGPHTQNEAATASAPTVEPADAGKPGRLQSAPSSPASGSSPIPSFSQFSRGEVSQEAPAPKPCSRLAGCAPPRCGPAPKPQPKPQPKAKGRKNPQPSSQPKLAQFFVAQTRKASTSSHTQGSPAHKAPACPKPPPCSPGPTQPAPTQVVSNLGLCSHGGGSPEGQGQREG